ncbi:MAG: MBL fold metallo-hydrolase [Mycobacteriales bacterium]
MRDAYTGDVTPGGPPAVRDVPGLRITKLSVGPLDNNVYLLRCTATGDTLLVDAAAEAQRILGAVGDGRLTRVVETHGHGDHTGSMADIRAATGAPLGCHAADEPLMPVPVDERWSDGDVITIGEAAVRCIHLAGHTAGGLALVYEGDPTRPHLFTGDSLFPGGPGNTRGDSRAFAQLMGDLETKVFDALADETWVYPGHGKDTTLGAERPSLPGWRARGW